jgi:hypothetical protein
MLDSLVPSGETANDTIYLPQTPGGGQYRHVYSQLNKPIAGVHKLYVYSAWKPASSAESGVAIDYLLFTKKFPVITKADTIIEAETYHVTGNLGDPGLAIVEGRVSNLWKGNYIGFRSIDFGSTGLDSFTVGGRNQGSARLYVTLDNPDTLIGRVLGRFSFGNTLDHYRFGLSEAVKDTHDVFLSCYLSNGNSISIDYFTFGSLRKETLPALPANRLRFSGQADFRISRGSLQYQLPFDHGVISLFGSDGSTAGSTTVKSRVGTIQANLPAGVYTVRAAGQGKTVNRTVVVSH